MELICNDDESKVIIKDADKDEDAEGDDIPLPGFRFHPTDEELVSFYLRRKVEKKSFSIELIKQIDIYKYDPWDLPKASNIGDKEWYFFCKRGRKYRNSLRPNRVTGSGFWKATGIDKPIYSGGGGGSSSSEGGRDCIGLKKSLVYYRGSAGKGTKTDWMMHEFRLPGEHDKPTNRTDHVKPVTQEEAEVWTLSRIFKRNVKYRKCMPDLSAAKPPVPVEVDSDSKPAPCSSSSNFQYSTTDQDTEKIYVSFNGAAPVPAPAPAPAPMINFSEAPSNYTNMIPIPADFFFLKNNIAEYWDELSSVVDLRAANSAFLM